MLGANTTLKLADCPADNVTGSAKPVKLKPAPVTLIWDTLTLELPVLVRVTGSEVLLPTLMFPKLSEVGLAESWRTGATPLPLRETAVGEFGALLMMEMLPVALPAAEGDKPGATCEAWLGPSSSRKVSPLKDSPTPLTVA